jgi:hypothetical protein
MVTRWNRTCPVSCSGADGGTEATVIGRGSNHDNVVPVREEHARKGMQPRGVDPVIVGDQHAHTATVTTTSRAPRRLYGIRPPFT